MAAANPTIVTFAGTPPPWSLTSLDANFANIAAIQNSVNTYTQYAADTGSANTYVIAFGAGVNVTFGAGLGVAVKATNANTGASTLNVGGTGGKPLVRADGSALVGGEIPTGAIFTAISDGTSYFLQSVVLPVSGYVNGLINGGMEVWQRGTSIAVAASSNGYTADRWTLTTNATQSHTMSQQTGLTNGSQFCIRVQRDAAQAGVGAPVFEQPFELSEIVKYRGQKISVSVMASTGANWSPTSGAFTVIIAAGTGAAGRRGTSAYAAETVVLTQSQNLAAGSGATAITASSSVIVPTNTTQMTLYFTWTPVGAAGANDWIQFDDVMWSIGLSPAPFERRPVAQELALCQRYFSKTFPLATAPAQNAGLAGSISSYCFVTGFFPNIEWFFPAPMRATPTITTYNPSAANANWRNIDAGSDQVVVVDPKTQISAASVYLFGSTGGTAGQISGIHATASAEL